MKNLTKKITSVALSSAVLVVSFLSTAALTTASASNAVLTLTDTVDKAIADRGDTLTYTITVKNTGETSTTNTFLWINLPNLANYVPGSSTYIFTPTPNITRNLTDSWINDGVNFGTMNPGDTMTLHYQTRVADNANPSDIIWSVAALQSDQTAKIQAQAQTEMVFLSTALCAKKTADKPTVMIGDTVTFTVKVCNQSVINLNDIIITDALNSPFKYVPGSTVEHIGGKDVAISDNWLNTGVNMGNLPVGTSATLTYQVTIDNTLKDGQVLTNVAHISAKESPVGLACQVQLTGKVLGITTTVVTPPAQLPNTGPGDVLLLGGALAPAGWLLRKFKSRIK